MPKYIQIFNYSSGSWARMIDSLGGDQTTAVQRTLESLGGSLECMYWQVGSHDGYAIFDVPDSVTAEAVEQAMTKTGAFKSMETHQAAHPEAARRDPASRQGRGGGLRGSRPAGLKLAPQLASGRSTVSFKRSLQGQLDAVRLPARARPADQRIGAPADVLPRGGCGSAWYKPRHDPPPTAAHVFTRDPAARRRPADSRVHVRHGRRSGVPGPRQHLVRQRAWVLIGGRACRRVF